MGEGVRREESSLPADYVSLAQLQERWLQKQNQEEEKSERDAWAQNENNQNQSGRTKMTGGFVRDSVVFHDKGKGKEILTGSPGNGGENDKRREISGGGKTRDFERDLGAGDQCEGAELADMKRPNLRGGLRGNGGNRSEAGLNSEKKVENERDDDKNLRRKGRERGSNEGYREMSKGLKEFRAVVSKFTKPEPEKRADDQVSMVSSEMGSLSVRDRNENSKGSNNAKENIFEREGSNGDKMKPEVEKVDREVLARESAKIGKKRGGMKGHNRSRNFDRERRHAGPNISAEKDGDKILGMEIKKEDHEVLAGESAKILGNDGAVKGHRKNKNQRRDLGRKGRSARPKISTEDDRIEGEGSDCNEVALEIEKKIEHEGLVGETKKPGEKRWVRKANQKNENQRRDFGKQKRYSRPETSDEEDRTQGECSNSSKVALEIEKKVDNVKGYPRKEDTIEGEGSDGNKLALEIEKMVDNVKGYPRKEDTIEGKGSNGNKVALEIEKKVDSVKGYPRKEDIIEEKGSNGNKVALEIEKKVDDVKGYPRKEDIIEGKGTNGNKVALQIEKEGHEILAWGSEKIGENRGGFEGYWRNDKLRRGFGLGDTYRRWEKSYHRRKMNSVESGMAWVKKEEKLGA